MTEPTCCAEFATVSRRGLLRGAAAVGAVGIADAALGQPLLGPSVFGDTFVEPAHAAVGAPSGNRVLVLLSLRGACDGLSLVVPHADPAYYRARPRIAVPKDSLLQRDAMFGLHPALAPLVPLWRAGKVATVHATGLEVRNRSHFAAMEAVEDADPGSPARTGWLNRMLGQNAWNSPLQGVEIGSEVPSTALYGAERTFSVAGVEEAAVAGDDQWQPTSGARIRSLRTLWGKGGGQPGVGLRSALDAVDGFAKVRRTPAAPANGAVYPDADLGRALAACARTVKADIGTSVLAVDHGGWDMHTGLGTLDWGDMRTRTQELAGAIAAFFQDLGDVAERVTLVTISEFGRRVRENDDYGLDHGWGNVMMLVGAGVRGGYHGRWPGLSDGIDADLSVTTDYRSVLAEVVTTRMGASASAVFPGFTPEPLGVITG